MRERLYIGIDLGGTNIKTGIVDSQGNVLKKISVPTGHGPDAVIANMVSAANRAVDQAGVNLDQIAAIGIASPGSLSKSTGVVVRCANLPGWDSVPLCDLVSKALGKPTIMENDARAAVYGEFMAGAGRSSTIRSMIMITLGTGVGSGMILDGRLVRGHTGMAGEIGHLIVVSGGELCGCGQRGCLEAYASASRVHRRAMQVLQNSNATSSLRNVIFKVGCPTARDVAEHARRGDTLALQIWDETCRFIAVGCVNASHLMDPEIIVLGGGMAAAGKLLLDSVERHFREQYWKIELPRTAIRIAELGNDAGFVGAALLAGEIAAAREFAPTTEMVTGVVEFSPHEREPNSPSPKYSNGYCTLR